MSDEAKKDVQRQVMTFTTESEMTDEEIRATMHRLAAEIGVEILRIEITPADDKPEEATP